MSEDGHLFRRTRRLLAELVVIAVGVFLGLAGDAGWDARQERVAERRYLRDLQAEMLLASEELAEDTRRRTTWRAQTDSIRSQIDQRTAPDSTLTLWIQGSGMQLTRYNPPASVLDDLVASGNLGLLRSDELRYALLSYQQNAARLRFIEDWARGADEDALRPYLMTHAVWIGGFGAGAYEPHSISAVAWQEMLQDPFFKNLMSMSHQRLGLVVRSSVGLSRTIERVLALIERELDRAGVAS